MSYLLSFFSLIEPKELLNGVVYRYDQLSPDQDYLLFGQIESLYQGYILDGKKPLRKIKVEPLPKNCKVYVYTEHGQRKYQTDSYGNPLTIVTAGRLKKLRFPKSSTSRNLAIKAYIDNLPDQHPLILYWN